MQILKTIFWVLLAVLLVLFSIGNWETVTVYIWQNLVLETKLPALVIGAFLLGLVPMWLIYRATKWRLKRRIAALEASLTAALPPEPVSVRSEIPPTTPIDPLG